MDSQEERSRRLFSFNGCVLSVEITRCVSRDGGSTAGSELRYKRMPFRKETGTFSVENEDVFPITRSSPSEACLVASAPVVDVKTGQMVVCILLRKRKKKSGSFKYVLVEFSSSGFSKPLLEFKLPYEMKDNVTFSQGPTVLWTNNSTVYYTSVAACEVRQVSIHLSSLSFIGEVPISNRKIIILGCQKSTSEEPAPHLGASWTHKSIGYFLEDEELFDGAWILPHAYSSVVKCVLFVSAEESSDGLRSSLVAATIRSQLVWFENGIPKNICQLPFEEPQSVQMASTGPDGGLFVVSFKHGNACGVWKSTFQVACCWQNITSLHVDDFAGCGTDQILLLFEPHGPPGGTLANFTLTDLGDVTYSGIQEEERTEANETVQENYLLTVQALESRLQGAMTSLRDLQRELEVKDGVLLQSVENLLNAVSGRPCAASIASQDLVSLWDEDTEEEEKGSAPDLLSGPISRAPFVEKLWWRVTEERLVVGVALTAAATGSGDSVNASLLLEEVQSPVTHVLQTSSRTFYFPQPSPLKDAPLLDPEPATKRKKRVPEIVVPKATVTAVTDLAPLLACGSPTCTVLLHGIREGVADPPVSMQCGRVSLDIQQVAQGKHHPHLVENCKFTTEECLEDLISLQAVLDSCSFCARSQDYTLCDVSQWLLGPMHCETVAVQPDYLLCTEEGPFAHMLFRWEQKTRFEGDLHLHYKSQCQLLQFLDALCRFLPPSCEVHQLRGGSPGTLCQALASVLKAEVLALRDGASSLLASAASRGRQGVRVPGTDGHADELFKLRAEMEEEREWRRRLGNPMVDLGGYRQFTAAVSNLQLETDVVAQTLWKSLSLPPTTYQDLHVNKPPFCH